MRPIRLAIVISHPIQYTSPWFRLLAGRSDLKIKVFYLINPAVTRAVDQGFRQRFEWDIPLLEGYDYEFVPNISSRPSTNSFWGLNNPSVVDQIMSWRSDAIVIYGYLNSTMIRIIASPRLRRIPMFFRGDSHDLSREGLVDSVGRLLRIVLFKRFSGFLCVGVANKQYLINSGASPSRIFQLPHCVDNERFRQGFSTREKMRLRESVGIPTGSRVFLFAGKLEQKKRPDLLLSAFQTLLQMDFQLHSRPVLVFMGSGELEEQLKRQAGEIAPGSVFFLGFKNQSEVPLVYHSSDVLVLPSEGKRETWGLVVNEFMNSSNPVIVSSDVGCCADLVVPSRTGWIFNAGDERDLTRALIEAALASTETLSRMGLQCLSHINKYSYSACTSALMSALTTSRNRSED